MDTVISFTPAQIIAALGGFTALCVAIGWVVKIVQGVRAPTKKLEERVGIVEGKMEAYEGYFTADKHRLDALEEGNRVTQKAILALLSHGIDGNDIDGLRTAKVELQEYLIERN